MASSSQETSDVITEELTAAVPAAVNIPAKVSTSKISKERLRGQAQPCYRNKGGHLLSIRNTSKTPARNAKCPCLSGKKWKRCCGSLNPADTIKDLFGG